MNSVLSQILTHTLLTFFISIENLDRNIRRGNTKIFHSDLELEGIYAICIAINNGYLKLNAYYDIIPVSVYITTISIESIHKCMDTILTCSFFN